MASLRPVSKYEEKNIWEPSHHGSRRSIALRLPPHHEGDWSLYFISEIRAQRTLVRPCVADTCLDPGHLDAQARDDGEEGGG